MAFGKRKTDPAADDEEHQTEPREVQFPSVAGEPEIEVAQRSADGSDATGYVKTFVIAGPDRVGDYHPCHQDSQMRVLEEAIQRGLHPKGPAVLVGSEVVDETRGVVSTACHYRVPVTPSAVDAEAHTTHTPSSQVRVTGRHAPTG